jgi:hypothetical protein
MTITTQEYTTLDDAYSYLNKHLFDNKLPECIITLQRGKPRMLGHFCFEKFESRENGKKVSELELNPDNFNDRSDLDILSTIAHEMAHVYQHHILDEHPRNGYHDKTWGLVMKDVGLYPSNTGEQGGKETGQQMTHWIIQGGKFEIAAGAFLLNHKLNWNSIPKPPKEKGEKKKNREKFTCPSCMSSVWGKSSLNIMCGDCEMKMVIEEE